MSATRIAVTGASGFVGRHLLDRLLRSGASVSALSRHGTGRSDVDDRRVDYEDAAALEEALRGIEVVVHLAARAHQLNESADTPEVEQAYQKANINAALAVAKATRANRARRLVFVSSIGVNGNVTHGKPFGVSDTPKPVEPYARSKWLAEQAIAELLGAGPTDFVILRPPLVYGPDCRGNFERLLKMAAHAPFLPLGDLRAPRTLIGIGNLVEAITVAASNEAVSRRTFLVTDSRDTNVGEILRSLARGCGRPSSIVVSIPSALLRLMARVLGKGATWDKLAAPLQVDGSEFCRVTGWRAAIDPTDGLYEAGRRYIRGARPHSP